MINAIIIGNSSPKIDNISAAQLFPFFDNRAQLKERIGLNFQHIQAVTLAEIEAAAQNLQAPLAFIRPSWREEADDVIDTFQRIHAANPSLKIIFIDPWDQETSRFFGVLPYVNVFVKYQGLKDNQEYKKNLLGGTITTDFLAREWGYDLEDWHVGSEVPAGYERRIISGWGVGSDRRFKQAMLNPLFRLARRRRKTIDVFCRVTVGSVKKLEWYGRYRMAAIEQLKKLEGDYTLAVSGEHEENRTTSSRQYFHEIKRSRIAFSPFGWGPTTWRDYEAICYNCLLVKPAMDRIDAKPNIYFPGETYVPVRWDLSDIEEKCRYYLTHWDEAETIINNAQQALSNYFKKREFVETIRQIIADAGL